MFMLKQDILEKSCEEIGKKLSSVIAMLSLIQIYYSFINTKINQHWFSENSTEQDDISVSAIIERANKHAGKTICGIYLF